MMNAFATKQNLRTASRLPSLTREAQISIAEVACLFACGALAVMLVGFVRLPWRVPGHAILHGVVPMSLGLALVPRRCGGILMAIGAAITAAGMSWAGFGRFQPAAVLSILALGPVLDIATAGRASGWRLYARFALAGALANCLAFATRVSTALLGWELAGARQFSSFWSVALVSFLLCGAIAGLLSAAIWFRVAPRGYSDDDLRRN